MNIRILLIIIIQVKAATLGKKTGYNEGKQIGEEDKILKTAHRLLYTKYTPYDHTVIGKLNIVRYPSKNDILVYVLQREYILRLLILLLTILNYLYICLLLFIR